MEVGDGVRVGVGVLVGVGVIVGDGASVGTGVGDGFGVGVAASGVKVGYGVGVGVDVEVGVLVVVGVAVSGDKVGYGVVGVWVGVGIGVEVGIVVLVGMGVAASGGEVGSGVEVGNGVVTMICGSGVGVAKMMRGALRNRDRHSSFHCWLMSGRMALIAKYPRMVRNNTIEENFHIFNFKGMMPFDVGVGSQRNADTLSNRRVSILLSVNVQTFHRTNRSKSSSVHRSFRVM